MKVSGFVSILVLFGLLARVQGPSLADLLFPRRCPRFREECEHKERDLCTRDRDCPKKEKCCIFNCGKKCLNPQQGMQIATVTSSSKCMIPRHVWGVEPLEREGKKNEFQLHLWWLSEEGKALFCFGLCTLEFSTLGVPLQISAACRKTPATVWLTFVVGGLIKKIARAKSSSMVAAKETITTSNPKVYARTPAKKKAVSPEQRTRWENHQNLASAPSSVCLLGAPDWLLESTLSTARP